jgi:hypothetical protein
LIPIGENLREKFWNIPQVGTLSFRFIIVFSLDFFTDIEGYSGGYSQLVLSGHLPPERSIYKYDIEIGLYYSIHPTNRLKRLFGNRQALPKGVNMNNRV